MKFVQLDFTTISDALELREQTGAPVPFNTSFHSATKAPDLVRPNDAPYSFKRWLPLILRTRQQPTSTPRLPVLPPGNLQEQEKLEQPPCPAVQTIHLPPAQTRLLLAATEASLPLRQGINRTFREDLTEEIAPLFERELIFPPQGLFLRLDACSPKDGIGPPALRSVQDVLVKVVTSVRARNALVHVLESWEDGVKGGVGGRGGGGNQEQKGVEMFFLPFDARMAGDREYRVFCRPGDGVVTGVSQYRWYRPWRFAGLGEVERGRVVQRILSGVEEVREMILEEVNRGEGGRLDGLFLEQGFSFDLFYDEEADVCSLVELNTFGVRSACGSCLFQWVNDRGVLYGQEEAEFRVAF